MSAYQATTPKSISHYNKKKLETPQEIGRTSRFSKQGLRKEKKENITHSNEGILALSRARGPGWVPRVSRSAEDCLADLGPMPAPPLPLFKEPELSFTNICLASAYHQESNVELTPRSSCLKSVCAVSSSKGQCAGLIVPQQHQGTLKGIKLNQWPCKIISLFFLALSLRYQNSKRFNKASAMAEALVGAACHRITKSSGARWAVFSLLTKLGNYTWHVPLGICHLTPKHSLLPGEPKPCEVYISGILP